LTLFSCRQETGEFVIADKKLSDSTSMMVWHDKGDNSYSIQFYKRTKSHGPQYFYNSKNILIDYKFYTNGGLRYYRRFDEKGVVRSYGGKPILNVDTFGNIKAIIDTTKQLIVKFKYIEPPKTKFRAMICDWDEKDSTHVKNTCFWCDNIKNTDSIRCDLDYKNKYKTKVVYWSLEDTTNGDIQKNSIYVKIHPPDK
jgi:hypothetical protein